MQYMTASDVKRLVKGPRSALRVSIRHWKQNARLTEKQLVALCKDVDDPDLCGMCLWHDSNCNECPLGAEYCCCRTNSLYEIAAIAAGDNNYPAFIAASKAMVKALESLL